tara:strand:+ start:676 stop:1200 length:525 start_codon:yes stop_codon:yes gene_type:complete
MIEMKKHVEPGKTPAQITVSMIDQDLKDGISKSEMAVKYGIKPWEVDEMFKHPFLKGRRPSRKKALSFTFVDDITENRIKETGTVIEQTAEVDEGFVDPNQVTLEDAIDEAIESVEEAKEELQKTESAIVNMLSPTETVGNTEYHEDLVNEIKALQSEDEDEDEIEMDDDTFEL